MLIVCNGAAKSGSTWLYNVVHQMVRSPWPDRRYLTSSKKHPVIRPDALEGYLRAEDFQSNDVVTKAHYGNRQLRDLLLARPDVRVLDMTRDLHDVIVSSYYDSCRRHGFAGSFSAYYWLEGRSLAAYLIRYHRLWGDGHPQVFVTSFESLKNDFANEVRRIADFMGHTLDDAAIDTLRQATSIDTLRRKYDDDEKQPFFRKGVIGDWKNHFDPRMLRDLSRIEASGDIGKFDVVQFANRIRRKLYAAFPRLSPYRKVEQGGGQLPQRME